LERNINDIGGSTSDVFELLIYDMDLLIHNNTLKDTFGAENLSGKRYNLEPLEKRMLLIRGLRETYLELEQELKSDFENVEIFKELRT